MGEWFLALVEVNLARRSGETASVVIVIVCSPLVTAWTFDTDRSMVVVSVGIGVGDQTHLRRRHQARLSL